MEKNTLNFIDTLISLETKNLIKDKIYNNVYDKYLNGHCEDLVCFLQNYNQDGEKIEIIGICENEDFDETVTHYVYKLNDKYYDINGSFDSLKDLVNEIGYIDYIKSFKVIDKNLPLENKVLETMLSNPLYLDILEDIEKNNIDFDIK